MYASASSAFDADICTDCLAAETECTRHFGIKAFAVERGRGGHQSTQSKFLV